MREVTFLGQNVNAYGKEPGFAGPETFADLLEEACAVPGIERIRFMTSHPKDVSDALIDVMARPNQVCEHLHLPVQSGSDRILAAMRRGYDRAAYLDLVAAAAGRRAGAGSHHRPHRRFPRGDRGGLRGHPVPGGGVRLRRGLHLHLLAAAADRGGAAAGAAWRPRSPRSAWSGWWSWCSGSGGSANEALVGRTVEVMVERASRQDAGEVMGRTRGHKPVNFASRAAPGDLVMVELLEATSTSFRGREAP